MKTTLTKNDPAGWYLADANGRCVMPIFWDGLNAGLWTEMNGEPAAGCYLVDCTNFRLLIEAPAEYHTVHERAEQFLSEFAANPISDTIGVFSEHLRAHTASLTGKLIKLAGKIEDLKAESLRKSAEAKFYETQMSETAALAAKHGWVPGSGLAAWLKRKLEPEQTDQSIGTQDTSDEIPGLGDGDDTWEEPSPDDRYEIAIDDEAILKCVPDSPGEWHNLKTQDILRVWESRHPDASGEPHLRGQFVFPDRCTTLAGSHISKFQSYTCDWVKAVPPVDANCEATKTLRDLTAAIHAVCDEAEIPSHQTKMARAHLPEPVKVQERLQILKQKIISDHDDRTVFVCPECGGTCFGTQNATLPFSQWVRQCHDQYGIGCRWEGKDKDCVLKAQVAAVRLSSFLSKRQWQLKEIGRIVCPAKGAKLREAVQSLADGLKATQQENAKLRTEKEDAVVGLGHSQRNVNYLLKQLEEFRTAVIEAAKPESADHVIDTIKALRAQRDHLRHEAEKLKSKLLSMQCKLL